MKTGDKVIFGGYEWRVLDIKGKTALIITEHIIEQRSYHDAAGGVTWAESSIRKYLNEVFYEKFAASDRSRIVPVLNVNINNQWYGSEGGRDTKDSVFLLSIEEAVRKYFGDSGNNLDKRSPRQRYWFQRKDDNNKKRRAVYDGYVWWWWLRSPGRDNRRAVYIHGDGNIGIQGNGTYRYGSATIHPVTGDNNGGVRPALWLVL